MADNVVTSIALFGLGRAGMIHVQNIIANHRAKLAYIVEVDQKVASDFLAKYRLKETKVVHPDDAQTVYDDQSVDAVFVCSPTLTHENIVRKSLESGKNVFCEKPIAQDIERTRSCYEEADKANRLLFCSFNRRFDPSVMSVRDSIQDGRLGQVYAVTTCSRDHPLPPMKFLETSGGLFHDCAVHDIDLVCWYLSEYPESVYSQAHCFNKDIKAMDDVDTVAIVMKFPSGILATLNLSRNSNYGYDQRSEVFGSEGTVSNGNQRPTETLFMNGKGQLAVPYKFSFPQRYADSYKGALESFLDVVQGKAKTDITMDSTIKCSMIAHACEQSLKTGQMVKVSLQGPLSTCNGF